MKKVALTENLCESFWRPVLLSVLAKFSLTDRFFHAFYQGTTYEEADHSVELMLEIFPELHDSTDLFFIMPAKKAIRRFPTSQPLPRPLHRSMHAHRILDDRIRRAIVEVADVALQKLPSLTINLEQKMTSRRLAAKSHPRLLEAVMSARGISNEGAVLPVVIGEILLKGTRRQPSFVAWGSQNAIVHNENGGMLDGSNS
jgi:hypothetical protein